MPSNPNSLEIVQVEKQESAALGGDASDEVKYGSTPINPEEDMIEVAGVTLVESGDTRPIKDRAIWPDGDDLRFRDITNPGTSGGGFTLTQLLDTFWALVSGHLEPQTDGEGVRLKDSTGNSVALLSRSSANFAISVSGDGSNAFYKNCNREVTQLGGTDISYYATVGNYNDAACHSIYADRTIKTYGNHRHQNGDTSGEYMDVGRNGSNGYIQVVGGAALLQLTQKILEARLGGSSSSEMFRIISDSGDAFRVLADLTSRFYGNVTHGGDVLPDGNNTRDLGSATARWANIYAQNEVRLTSGSVSYTQYKNGSITSVSGGLTINGGFGLTFKVTQVLGDSTFKFVGKDSTKSGHVRSYYGTGTGTTWSSVSHDGTDGKVETGTGDLKLSPAGSLVVAEKPVQFPSYTVVGAPSASPAGQMIYVSDETGGAVMAFSDGTNWRRTTDRAIIS